MSRHSYPFDNPYMVLHAEVDDWFHLLPAELQVKIFEYTLVGIPYRSEVEKRQYDRLTVAYLFIQQLPPTKLSTFLLKMLTVNETRTHAEATRFFEKFVHIFKLYDMLPFESFFLLNDSYKCIGLLRVADSFRLMMFGWECRNTAIRDRFYEKKSQPGCFSKIPPFDPKIGTWVSYDNKLCLADMPTFLLKTASPEVVWAGSHMNGRTWRGENLFVDDGDIRVVSIYVDWSRLDEELGLYSTWLSAKGEPWVFTHRAPVLKTLYTDASGVEGGKGGIAVWHVDASTRFEIPFEKGSHLEGFLKVVDPDQARVAACAENKVKWQQESKRWQAS